MILRSVLLTTTKTNMLKGRTPDITLARLPQYAICLGLGLLGGALGVAFTIGLTIIIQARLGPAAVFLPTAIPFTIIATLFGLAASWLLGRATDQFLSRPCCSSDRQGLQLIMIVSVITSLLESLLFMHNL